MSSIKEILIELGYTVSENATEFRAKPVYRDSSSNTVLRISKKDGYYIDFAANISGSFLDLIKLSLNLQTVKEAKEFLKGKKFNLEIIKREKPRLNVPKVFDESMLKDFIPDHSYWNGRGISNRVLESLGGGIVTQGRCSGRYCFPIINEMGKLVGFDGRLLKNSDFLPKWLKLGAKSKWIYPQINLPFIQSGGRVVLTESIGDCISLMECNINNVLCIFGCEISQTILKELIKLDLEKIYIAFNNDKNNNSVGNRAAEKAQFKLKHFFDAQQIQITLPNEKDFNDELIKNGKNAIIKWYNDL